jgi:predicted dehydrogenase
LTEAIAKGASCIYLEKPGAPTVAELEQMAKEAADAGVEVLMGYNKVRILS